MAVPLLQLIGNVQCVVLDDANKILMLLLLLLNAMSEQRNFTSA
jgi:hypothetical protein